MPSLWKDTVLDHDPRVHQDGSLPELVQFFSQRTLVAPMSKTITKEARLTSLGIQNNCDCSSIVVSKLSGPRDHTIKWVSDDDLSLHCKIKPRATKPSNLSKMPYENIEVKLSSVSLKSRDKPTLYPSQLFLVARPKFYSR